MYNKTVFPTAWNNGYKCFYDKEHPLATTDGRVFYHRHLMSMKLNRWVTNKEEVHHIDGNRENNSLDNLQLLTKSEHSKIHNPKQFSDNARGVVQMYSD